MVCVSQWRSKNRIPFDFRSAGVERSRSSSWDFSDLA